MKLLYYVLTTCYTLDVFSMSLPKVNKSEGLNEILKTLIKQAEGGLNSVKSIAKYNGENDKNDSAIIYIKTTAKPNTALRHKSSRSRTSTANYYNDNIYTTEAPKNHVEFSDDSGYPINQTDFNEDAMTRSALKDNDSNQSVISEEIVFEINPKDEHAKGNVNNNFAPEDQLLRMKSAAPSDEYPNIFLPTMDNDIFNFKDLPVQEPDFISNFPGIMTDPELSQENFKGTEEQVKAMIRELSAIERIEDRMAELEKLVINEKFKNILKEAVKKITSQEMNSRIGEHLTNRPSVLKSANLGGSDQFATLQSTLRLPGLFPVIQPRIRTVIHHQAYPLEQWPLGQRCCTTFT